MNSNHSLWGFSARTQAELELLQSILDNREAYVWNPSLEDSETYLSQFETAWGESGLNHDQVSKGWQTVSQQLDIMWQSLDQAGAGASVLDALTTRFANRMPADLLAEIARRAEDVVSSGKPVLNQMLHCVKDILAAWDETDLQVMARPMAYAMRDGQGEIVEVTLQSVRDADWASLSPMEQARLSLAIARYAIDQVDA
ncbi:MAG: hypothetical protein AAF651_01965 [Cyanobacteria bacterium P01_C01_bin.73]